MRDMGNQAEVAQRPETWRDESVPVTSRIAFVSGGMGGIGTAICRRLGRIGHTVVAGCLPDYDRKDEWLGAERAARYHAHAAAGAVSDLEPRAQLFYNRRPVGGPRGILPDTAANT